MSDTSDSDTAPSICAHCGITTESNTNESRHRSVRIEELCSTNECPRDAERDEFVKLAADGRDHLKKLEMEITEARETLRALIEQRDRTQQDLSDYAAVLHPVRRLPNEILSEIFTVCHEIHEILKQTTQMEPVSWDLSQTSSRWRMIALSNSRLWSSIDLLVRADMDPRKIYSQTFLLGLQLQRSSTSPLILSLTCFPHVSIHHPTIQMLLPSSQRWQRAYLTFGPTSLSIFSHVQGFLQSLIHLYVDLILDMPGPVLPPPLAIQNSELNGAFKFAPMLYSLIGVPTVLHSCQFPWSQMTTYGSVAGKANINYWSSHRKHLDILCLMPNLKTCNLLLRPDANRSKRTPPLELKQLFAVSLSERSEDGSAALLLGSLELPLLRVLNLFGPGKDTVQYLRSSPHRLHLHQIHIDSASLSDIECLSLLEAIPSLLHLSLRCPKAITTNLLSQLLEPLPDKVPILPSLRSLGLSGYVGLDSVLLVQLKEARPGLVIRT